MRKFYIFLSIVALFHSCNSSKMGKIQYGENGVIKSGTGVSRCTHPQKTYTKSLEVVVKGTIDSIAKIGNANLNVGLRQAVTRLNDYSPEGLDIDLILFRVCEMANNRGLNATQIDELTKIVLDAWSGKKESTIAVTNNGVNNGVMGGVFIIPEDKDLPIENNFTITSSKIDIGNNIIKPCVVASPKQGLWYTPFFAYPEGEDSLVNGSMGTPMFNSNISDLIYRGKQLKVKLFFSNSLGPASASNQYLFNFDKLPSIIFFGDLSNPKKIYSMISN